MPEPGNPQALNRYSYVLNNPLRYTDPTGMFEQSAIEEYLRSLKLDNWQDILKNWKADDQWWTALLAAQAGDILTALDPEGNMRFAKFEGEGQTHLSGLTLVNDVFGNGTLGTARLDEVYGGSLGLPAAVVTFNQQGQMDNAYGLNGFRADISTTSEDEAKFYAIVFSVGLAGIWAYIPAETAAAWLAKTIGTSTVGATVVPDVRCYLGMCAGDQWLTVSLSAWFPGTASAPPTRYWKYWSEIRYHHAQPGYRLSIAN